MCARQRQRGFTLVEMIVAIVVIGVGLAGLMMAFATATRGSADPLMQAQMLAIAEELMEEIQLKPFDAAAGTAPAGCARDTFTRIGDYHGYAATTQVCSVEGVVDSELTSAGYRYSITVVPAALGSVASTDARRITITVTRGSDSLRLVGWRTHYAAP